MRRMAKIRVRAGAIDDTCLPRCEKRKLLIITIVHVREQRWIVQQAHSFGELNRRTVMGDDVVIPQADFVPHIPKQAAMVFEKLSLLWVLGEVRCQGQVQLFCASQTFLVSREINCVWRMGTDANMNSIRLLS